MINEPELFDKWNRAHQGSFKKGYRAHHEGKAIDEYPYKDHRQESGHLTWSRSFISAWVDGWNWAKNGS